MKVIFLDFNGVLQSVASIIYHNRRRVMGLENGSSIALFCPIACSNLEYILEECPDAWIVVSSSWRKNHTVQQLQEIFVENKMMPSRILDTTPDLESSDLKEKTRGAEIQAWLKNHPDVLDFVIIDDFNDMEPYKDRLVQVNSNNGLTFTDAEKVIEMMGRK